MQFVYNHYLQKAVEMNKKKEEVIIISFSEEKSGGFDYTDCSHKNILLSSLLWLKEQKIYWVNDVFYDSHNPKEFSEIFLERFDAFNIEDAKIFASLRNHNHSYVKSENSISWNRIFEDVFEKKSYANNLIKIIDNDLLSKSDNIFIGFKQTKDNLFYLNTDQLYNVNNTGSKKPKLPDFLIRAWCDAYKPKQPENFEYKLLIHDKEVDGYYARPAFYDSYECNPWKDKIVHCKINTFSHDILIDKRFTALKNKDAEKIRSFFRNGLSVLNFIIEALQISIIRGQEKETIIELSEQHTYDLENLQISKSDFDSELKTAYKEKKITLSSNKVYPFIDFLSSILNDQLIK